MLDILFINGTVITVNEENEVIQKGFVAVKDGIIEAVGSMEELNGKMPEAARVMDMKGHAVMPGLIDGHGHSGHCILRNLAEHLVEWDDISGEVYNCCTDDEFWYNEGALAAAERIKFGTTTAVSMIGGAPRSDYVEMVDAAMAGASITGLKQFIGTGAPSFKLSPTKRYHKDGTIEDIDATPQLSVKVTEEAVKTLNGKYERIKCIPAPGRMGKRPGIDDETNIWLNREMHRISVENNLPLHTHAYAGDVKFMHETSPEVLRPQLSLTHSTGYSEEEMEILKDTGAYVFHGPTTYTNALGHCKVIEMLEMGINLAVVTDGTAPDRSFDLWRDMKNVQLLQRFRKRDGGLLPCGTVLRLVTMEPAKALGIDHETGSLEAGKKADIITVNVMQPHLAPFGIMPIQRLVYHAMGQDVDNVIIDGEIVMENRVLTRVDEMEILENAEKSSQLMLERLGKPYAAENERLYDTRMY